MIQAAVLTKANEPLHIWDIWHEPLGIGQVKVRLISAGICGALLQEVRGQKGNYFPRLMGHEGVGVVQEIGLGVKTVAIGDKVVLHWRPGSGIESDHPKWNCASGQFTSGLVTTFSEEVVVSENRITAVPHDTPDDLCVLLGCGLSTALGVIERDADLKIGENVLIIGNGGVGRCLEKAAIIRGASNVTMLGPSEFTSDAYDVVIDTSGNSDAIEMGIRRLMPSGRMILVGQPSEIRIDSAISLFEGNGKTIKASQGGGFVPQDDLRRYIDVFTAWLIECQSIITHRIRLPEINSAFDLMKEGQTGRILIDFQ